eukprot:2606403-Amphidinium_carterae.1
MIKHDETQTISNAYNIIPFGETVGSNLLNVNIAADHDGHPHGICKSAEIKLLRLEDDTVLRAFLQAQYLVQNLRGSGGVLEGSGGKVRLCFRSMLSWRLPWNSIGKLGMGPGKSSGNYSTHLDTTLKIK